MVKRLGVGHEHTSEMRNQWAPYSVIMRSGGVNRAQDRSCHHGNLRCPDGRLRLSDLVDTRDATGIGDTVDFDGTACVRRGGNASRRLRFPQCGPSGVAVNLRVNDIAVRVDDGARVDPALWSDRVRRAAGHQLPRW
jgi:hypothetical protein